MESMSLNFVVGGFSFAAAIAWMDVVRFLISKVVSVDRSGGQYVLLSAVFTTLMAILVFMIIKNLATNVKIAEPQTPVYAVTRA
jgi:hypothetical protein